MAGALLMNQPDFVVAGLRSHNLLDVNELCSVLDFDCPSLSIIKSIYPIRVWRIYQ